MLRVCAVCCIGKYLGPCECTAGNGTKKTMDHLIGKLLGQQACALEPRREQERPKSTRSSWNDCISQQAQPREKKLIISHFPVSVWQKNEATCPMETQTVTGVALLAFASLSNSKSSSRRMSGVSTCASLVDRP